jgi:hypothetical protein
MEVHAWKKGGSLTTPPGTVAGKWESRKAYLRAPWQTPPKMTFQEQEEAIKTNNTTTSYIQVYTDRSGYNGQTRNHEKGVPR